jgi:hypothetical protein
VLGWSDSKCCVLVQDLCAWQGRGAVERQGDRVRCMRFWGQITRGVALRVGNRFRHAPLVPKPGHLTRSPCLALLELVGFIRKQVVAHVLYVLIAIKFISTTTTTAVTAVTQLYRSSCRAVHLKARIAQCNRAFAFLSSKQCSGVVIGSGDRALGCKACVWRTWRADARLRA